MSFLQGKKTYIAAAGFAVLAAAAFVGGDTAGAFNYALQALGLFGLRSAISSQAAPADPAAK